MFLNDKSVGYIFHTGAVTADSTRYQQLVTIDGPIPGIVVDSCIGRQGPYFLSYRSNLDTSYVHVLPIPGGTTDVPYEKAKKMTYIWRSKKFVMPGRTTMSAVKVVKGKGCLKLRLYVDGCCRFSKAVKNCVPFRLPDQIAGITFEIELIGDAHVMEVHVASSMKELLSNV